MCYLQHCCVQLEPLTSLFDRIFSVGTTYQRMDSYPLDNVLVHKNLLSHKHLSIPIQAFCALKVVLSWQWCLLCTFCMMVYVKLWQQSHQHDPSELRTYLFEAWCSWCYVAQVGPQLHICICRLTSWQSNLLVIPLRWKAMYHASEAFPFPLWALFESTWMILSKNM